MTQISRPFQIALAAVVLLAGVWFFALRGHTPSGESSSSSSSGSSSSGPSAAASSPATPSTGSAASQNAPGGGTKASEGNAYHGSAPGVAGLSRAIDKAQGAVKQSEQNAQRTSSQPASSVQSTGSTPTTTAGATHATPAPATAPAHAHAPTVASKLSKQALVEGELKHGRTVIVLFWSSRGSVDVAVRRQLATLQASMTRTATPPQDRDIAVHYSSAGEVGQYGTITRSLQVLQTPTMLVISPSGKTKTLTGLVDAYAIRQAIEEARHA